MCSLGEQGIYAQHHIQYHLITLHSKRVPVSHLLSLLSFKNGFIQSYRMYMSFKVKGFARIWDYVYFECHYTVYVNWWNLIESCGCDVKRLFFLGSGARLDRWKLLELACLLDQWFVVDRLRKYWVINLILWHLSPPHLKSLLPVSFSTYPLSTVLNPQ